MSSAPPLTIDSPMGEILAALPGARRALFARYHLGGCQSCGFPPEETLAQLCARSGPHDPHEALVYLLDSHRHDESLFLSPSDLATLLASPHPPLLLDSRTREEFDAVRIPQAQFLEPQIQQQLFAGDPQTAIVIYDHQGRHALDHAAWFLGHGLKNTRVLRGGIDAWSLEVDPSLPRYRLEIEG